MLFSKVLQKSDAFLQYRSLAWVLFVSAVFSDLHIFNILKIILFKILDQLVVWFLVYVNYQRFPLRSKANVLFSWVLNVEVLFQSTDWLPECFRLHVINPIPDLLLHWKLILQVMSSFQMYRLRFRFHIITSSQSLVCHLKWCFLKSKNLLLKNLP